MTAAVSQPAVVVQEVAQSGVPLGAVAVEPEEVRSLHLQGGLLRAGDAVDERHLGVVLGVVGDGDAFVARERADHDLGAVLLDELADLLDDAVGGVVTATDADHLDRHVHRRSRR